MRYDRGKKGGINMMIIIFLLIGWLLSWFNFDMVFIRAFDELFNMDITTASYYFIFFLIGAVGDLITYFRRNPR